MALRDRLAGELEGAAGRISVEPARGIFAMALFALVLALALHSFIGFSGTRLDQGLGLVGSLVLAWPGLKLNAQAYHRHRMARLEEDLRRRIDARGDDRPSRVLDDASEHLKAAIEAERLASSDWTPAASACLVGGIVLVIAAGIGSVFLS